MGLFGADHKRIGGLDYELSGEFPSAEEANGWATQYRNFGLSARVVPNARKQCFEVWLSVKQVVSPTPPQQQPQQQ